VTLINTLVSLFAVENNTYIATCTIFSPAFFQLLRLVRHFHDLAFNWSCIFSYDVHEARIHHHHQTRSNQPKRPAFAIVRQNGLSSASSRASVAVTPVSRQIWWIQVVVGRPLARLHSCEGRSPSLVLVQIRRIWFAGASLWSLATWPKRPSLRLRTMYEMSNRPERCKTSSLDTESCQLMCRMRRWHLRWKESNLYQSACVRV